MRRRPLRHVTFALGAAITLLLVLTAATSLVYTPSDPLAMSIAVRFEGPSAAHPFGTDQYGRDVLSRIMRGAVTSIAVGVIAVGLGGAAGIVIGMLSGYAGGWLDETLMRLIDAVQGFPAILSALLSGGPRSRSRRSSHELLRIARCRPCCCARESTVMLRMESPPNSKKLSFTPTVSISRTSLQIRASSCSCAAFGAKGKLQLEIPRRMIAFP